MAFHLSLVSDASRSSTSSFLVCLSSFCRITSARYTDFVFVFRSWQRVSMESRSSGQLHVGQTFEADVEFRVVTNSH